MTDLKTSIKQAHYDANDNIYLGCSQHVMVLCDDGEWRPGRVIERETTERIGVPNEVWWTVELDSPPSAKLRIWKSSERTSIKPDW